MKQSNIPNTETTTNFREQFDAAPADVQLALADALDLFAIDPHHDSLHNHALKDRYAGFRSINVTPDWRAIFKETSSAHQTVTTFYFLGTHEELYGV